MADSLEGSAMAETNARNTRDQFRATNLFANLPDAGVAEVTEALADGRHTRIERIVSRGQASPPGFWYDQDRDEWVAVLKGRARLRLEGRPGHIEMGPGDWLNLPAHTRHRVEWTDPGHETVWLAVHYPKDATI
jgi:cupin 2 domain-containing protein